jgi:hypothetical protein
MVAGPVPAIDSQVTMPLKTRADRLSFGKGRDAGYARSIRI